MKEIIRPILPSSDLMLAGRYTPTKDMREDILIIFYIRTYTHSGNSLSHTHTHLVSWQETYIYIPAVLVNKPPIKPQPANVL